MACSGVYCPLISRAGCPQWGVGDRFEAAQSRPIDAQRPGSGGSLIFLQEGDKHHLMKVHTRKDGWTTNPSLATVISIYIAAVTECAPRHTIDVQAAYWSDAIGEHFCSLLHILCAEHAHILHYLTAQSDGTRMSSAACMGTIRNVLHEPCRVLHEHGLHAPKHILSTALYF